jgi:glycosyltransferase involved in cell wall biosynthesis
MALISVITPCYNEAENIRECSEAVERLFSEKLPAYEYEHIFCDNASSDNTVAILKEMASVNRRIKIIVNARNFGPFRSTFNALMQAQGDAAVVMLAADLQDPPEMIERFLHEWERGTKVVYGIRRVREEGIVLRAARRVFYRIVNMFSDFYIPPDAGEFQLIDRVVVEALRKFDDYYPYIRGMIASCGFPSVGIEYVWRARKRGMSKNRLYHLIDQALNGIISFTNIPMRICIIVGFIISFASILYAFVQLALNIFYYRRLTGPGIATLIVGLFLFCGVQLFFLGMLGEYVSAVHFQVRKRPLVIEKERINFSDAGDQ